MNGAGAELPLTAERREAGVRLAVQAAQGEAANEAEAEWGARAKPPKPLVPSVVCNGWPRHSGEQR